MATMTFTYVADRNQSTHDAQCLNPTVEYKIEFPSNTFLHRDDIYFHIDAWLSSLGYSRPD